MHRPVTDPASSRMLRVESMSLDCGGTAVVMELDRTPERAWMKSLKRALQADTALEGAQAKFDGRFVYIVGMEESGHRVQHRVVQALMAMEGGQAMDANREHLPVGRPWMPTASTCRFQRYPARSPSE